MYEQVVKRFKSTNNLLNNKNYNWKSSRQKTVVQRVLPELANFVKVTWKKNKQKIALDVLEIAVNKLLKIEHATGEIFNVNNSKSQLFTHKLNKGGMEYIMPTGLLIPSGDNLQGSNVVRAHIMNIDKISLEENTFVFATKQKPSNKFDLGLTGVNWKEGEAVKMDFWFILNKNYLYMSENLNKEFEACYKVYNESLIKPMTNLKAIKI
ncbi:hypothetical protein Sden_3141 [Shewanella denitrificans OS217]|jgi:hypothetical protein|uniref:Uncharacterized protein n=1 Tax=Shewanella denitrificans (strain OS217 / ATCC BAA-1090 / DSM 15013) TaxID=318161 RepID=Q12JF9_SHEDO|nr:hypothetical protein [Shewanella denitrificans]ABE56417.1 hypothetical protein Sden_3141 [Shewanella denitrificans OS217]